MFDLKALRAQIGVTQAQMAEAMGMPFRSYQDVEAGVSKLRPVHIAAAKWGAIVLTADQKKAPALPSDMREIMREALEASNEKPAS